MQVRNKYTGKIYVVAESRLSALPSEKPKSSAANGPGGDSKKSSSKTKVSSGKKAQDGELARSAENNESYEKLGEVFSGAYLVGKKWVFLLSTRFFGLLLAVTSAFAVFLPNDLWNSHVSDVCYALNYTWLKFCLRRHRLTFVGIHGYYNRSCFQVKGFEGCSIPCYCWIFKSPFSYNYS